MCYTAILVCSGDIVTHYLHTFYAAKCSLHVLFMLIFSIEKIMCRVAATWSCPCPRSWFESWLVSVGRVFSSPACVCRFGSSGLICARAAERDHPNLAWDEQFRGHVVLLQCVISAYQPCFSIA